MSKEIRLGEYNLLRVKEEAHREGFGEVFGMYLDAGREGEILMPQKYVPEGTMPGELLLLHEGDYTLQVLFLLT